MTTMRARIERAIGLIAIDLRALITGSGRALQTHVAGVVVA